MILNNTIDGNSITHQKNRPVSFPHMHPTKRETTAANTNQFDELQVVTSHMNEWNTIIRCYVFVGVVVYFSGL